MGIILIFGQLLQRVIRHNLRIWAMGRKCSVLQIWLQTPLALHYSYVLKVWLKLNFVQVRIWYIWGNCTCIHKAVQLESKLQHTGTWLVTAGLPHHMSSPISATLISLCSHSHQEKFSTYSRHLI